jgi:hypothetical protein
MRIVYTCAYSSVPHAVPAHVRATTTRRMSVHVSMLTRGTHHTRNARTDFGHAVLKLASVFSSETDLCLFVCGDAYRRSCVDASPCMLAHDASEQSAIPADQTIRGSITASFVRKRAD